MIGMSCDIIGINILSAAMGGAIVYYFCYSNYGIRLRAFKTMFFILVFGVVNGLISSFMIQSGDLVNTIKPIVLTLVSIPVIQIFLGTKIYQSIVALFIYILCLGIGNSSMPLLINLSAREFTTENMLANPCDLLIVNVLCNLITYVIIFTVKPLRTFFAKITTVKTVFPVLLINFLILIANSGLHFYVKVFNLAAYIIISALSVLYCAYVIIVSSKLVEQETSKLEIEQQKFYNESLNSTIFSLRRFKHDWNNNLTVINSMLNMNKIDELKQYMSELLHPSSDSLDTAIYNIKNAGLFGIISSKLNQARDTGIAVDFTVSGEVEDIPEIKISELCEVIGIFIDNALEEASKADKSIKINIYSTEQFLEISISNSCSNEPDMKMIYEEGYSSKGEGRGLGLAIAKKILGRYKAIQHITDFEDNVFTQTVTIEKGR